MYAIGTKATDWLRSAHTASAYVEITAPSTYPYGTYEKLDITDGTIDMDASALVRTTGSFTLSPEIWDRAQLWPWYGVTIKATYIIGAVDMVTPPVLVPFPPLIVEKASRSLPGADVVVEASDPMRLCEYADFPWPMYVASYLGANKLYSDFLAWLMTASKRQPDPTNTYGSNPALPGDLILDSSRNRLEYIRDTADTLLDDVWINRAGYWQADLANRQQAVSWSIDASASGVMLSADDELSGEKVRNDVVVGGEQTNGQQPVYARAQDADPNSPTYVSGPFGARMYKRSSGFIRDTAGMNNLALAVLAQQKLLRVQSKVEVTPAPHLDPTDLVLVSLPYDSPRTRQIETISHSLVGGACSIGLRAWTYGS